MAGARPILQDRLPVLPWQDRALSRMPGMRPVEGNWIIVDDAYGPQMRERARLIRNHRNQVLRSCRGSEAAQAELLEVIHAALPTGFERQGDKIRRPDGAVITARGTPLEQAAQLLQEDLLLLEKRDEEHVLTAGVLCFPASWTLAEKIGKPLRRIHRPVTAYTDTVARRVQRLFDHVRVGQPIWRANALGYADATLFQPRPEDAPRDTPERVRFLRSERQTVLRLPRTDAVLFAVHTWVVPLSALTPEQRVGCPVV